jgi:hypothetical protein
MTSETYNPADELRLILAEDRISEDALLAITGIQPQELWAFLNGAGAKPGMIVAGAEPLALSNDEIRRLSILAPQLTEGMRIGNDERLKAIFESLTVECRLTPRNIARLTGVHVDVIENVLREPRTISIEKKYELAIKGSYLINAVNQARGQYESTTHR